MSLKIHFVSKGNKSAAIWRQTQQIYLSRCIIFKTKMSLYIFSFEDNEPHVMVTPSSRKNVWDIKVLIGKKFEFCGI